MNNEALSRWVKTIGAKKAAELCGVREPAIYHWLRGTRQITAERAVQIEEVTRGALRREDLRPDLFKRK